MRFFENQKNKGRNQFLYFTEAKYKMKLLWLWVSNDFIWYFDLELADCQPRIQDLFIREFNDKVDMDVMWSSHCERVKIRIRQNCLPICSSTGIFDEFFQLFYHSKSSAEKWVLIIKPVYLCLCLCLFPFDAQCVVNGEW